MAKKEQWFAEQIRNRSSLSWGHNYTKVPGCEVIEAIWDKIGFPIGTLWFTHCGAHTVDIVSLYVMNHYRRMGVATFLLEKLITEIYPKTKVVITGEGNKYSTDWLKKQGFKLTDIGWKKEIKKK